MSKEPVKAIWMSDNCPNVTQQKTHKDFDKTLDWSDVNEYYSVDGRLGQEGFYSQIRWENCDAFYYSLLEIHKAHWYIKGSEKSCSKKTSFAHLP